MLVWPKDDNIRKILKHPGNAVVPFREEGPADWPDDTFTYRRIQEGDLLVNDPNAHSAPEPKVKAK